MSAHCCEYDCPAPGQIPNLARHRRVLWVALLINAGMFLAALEDAETGTAWPDALVATLMAGLALHGGWQVLRQARGELGVAAAQTDGHDHHGHAH